jgi:hypothetical protein
VPTTLSSWISTQKPPSRLSVIVSDSVNLLSQ